MPSSPNQRFDRFALFAIVTVVLVSGCMQTEEAIDESIEFDEPRSSGGVVMENSPRDWADRWSDVLERTREAARTSPDAPKPRSAPALPAERETETAPSGLPTSSWPAASGKLIDLPRLSRTELSEVLEVVTRRLETESRYYPADPATRRSIPDLPGGVIGERVLLYESEAGRRLLRFGYFSYRSHLPQFVVYGATITPDGLEENPDYLLVQEALDGALAALREMREGLTITDLETKIIQLSYVDSAAALETLAGLGIRTVAAGSKEGSGMPEKIRLEELPLVVEMPAPKPENIGIVAKTKLEAGEFGSTVVPTLPGDIAPEMVASPAERLLVLFHPAHPDQYSQVRRILDDVIDRPARQIFVEGMILEITDAGLQELGIQWEFENNKFDTILGSLNPMITENAEDTLDLFASKSQDLATDWMLRIRSLVLDGKAEILSRPSILTLNNRQATIRIGRDVPIATSQEGLSGDSNKIAFDFKYLALGILLNIRPRVSEDGREISLMVDTMVSARLPEADLEIRDEDGTLLASAPQVDSRRVQTYARIQNNTPFIIGGLVSRDKLRVTQKVPILGDIPILGRLFRSDNFRDVRTEVIIVLTPYVLPETLHLSRALPKGEHIDSSGNELFQDTYRIQQSDIVKLGFLFNNVRFKIYERLARAAVRENFRLGEREPFRSFSKKNAPGEQVLIHRILFNATTRLDLNKIIESERIIVLTEAYTGGYEVAFLEDVLEKRDVGEDYRDFFSDYPDKALVLSFDDPRDADNWKDLVNDPVPARRVVDCPDRRTWERLMWELNQPRADGRRRYSIVLHEPEDLERLRTTIMLRFILEVNGVRRREQVSILNFIPGRIFEVPYVDKYQPYMLDAEIARYYFHSVHYYAQTIKEIEELLRRLDKELRTPELEHLLEDVDLPPFETRK